VTVIWRNDGGNVSGKMRLTIIRVNLLLKRPKNSHASAPADVVLHRCWKQNTTKCHLIVMRSAFTSDRVFFEGIRHW